MNENNQEIQEVKPEVRINGKLYRLRFDLWALEQIEKEFGGVRGAFDAMSGNGPGMMGTVRKLFAILANCQRDLDGQPTDVTGEEITGHMPVRKVREISAAIRAAIQIGNKSETYGGEADDEERDALAEEYDRKNG
jgi:hypothetical protein